MNSFYKVTTYSIGIITNVMFFAASAWIAIPGLVLLFAFISKLLSIDLFSYMIPKFAVDLADDLYNNIEIIDIPALYIFIYTIFKKNIKLKTFDISIINLVIVISIIPLSIILYFILNKSDFDVVLFILLIYLPLSISIFSVLINVSRHRGYFSIYAKISSFIVFAETFILTI